MPQEPTPDNSFDSLASRIVQTAADDPNGAKNASYLIARELLNNYGFPCALQVVRKAHDEASPDWRRHLRRLGLSMFVVTGREWDGESFLVLWASARWQNLGLGKEEADIAAYLEVGGSSKGLR